VDQLSRVFAALADPTRRDLVARLTDGDATVGELAAPYEVSVQAVSKHLKVLEGAGLVSRANSTHRSPVHLEAQIFDLASGWLERYRRQAERRYERLDAVLAAMHDESGKDDVAPRSPGDPGNDAAPGATYEPFNRETA
jgi:DNA-binding transcriptional ArsR family regulator